MKQMGGWVYMMCSTNHSSLYVGVNQVLHQEFMNISIKHTQQAFLQSTIVSN